MIKQIGKGACFNNDSGWGDCPGRNFIKSLILNCIMENTKEAMSFGLHLGFKIAKLALQAAAVAAAFCLVKEVHKVHHSIKKLREK